MNHGRRTVSIRRTRAWAPAGIAVAVALLVLGVSWAAGWGGATAAGPAASSAQVGTSDTGLARQLARTVARGVGQVFATARGQLVELSRLRAVRTHDVHACEKAMAARLSSGFDVLEAADRSADVWCSAPPLTDPVNLADRVYFLRAIGTRGFAVGDFQIGKVSGQQVIGMGYPTRSGSGAINGIVLSPLSLTWLDRYVERTRPHTAFDVLLVDDHGTVLARAGAIRTPLGRNLGADALVKQMLEADQGAGHFRLGGHRVASAFRTVPSSDGAVHVAVSVR